MTYLKSHPAQILSDVFTIEEITKRYFQAEDLLIGDTNNVLNSLIEFSLKFS